ncbi:serine/threonine-protein kinase unc-51-like isoform X2 [Coccinella septempunctata]|uniref:serine/threonine-protein kinase unc-51-like isoform X2 n=1 Tax=Coccinella septempunctata TaxID=41139 RepID=UPI001D06D919|nr:serine/threonine-protein kinase unc-51-like isoform X2 [Coccinella septempunctata]
MDKGYAVNKIGQVVAGEYEICHAELIGHGAFACVYRGRKIKDKNFPVAIKAITKKNVNKCQALLSKEINILKQLAELNNPNLVSMISCEETPSHVFLVMEFCNGGDLADYFIVKKTLSEDTLRIFLLQIASAMKALRTLGIVHRDLKPQNILLSFDPAISNPQPYQITLKLADFGFARTLEEGGMAGTLCGSPMYMAPEVIMSLQYDSKADLWSIGTIVYQALTGKPPFSAPNPQALKNYYEKTLNLLPKMPSSTSPELQDFLTRLMKRNPKERLSFDEFFNHPFLQRDQNQKKSPIPGEKCSNTPWYYSFLPDFPLPLFEPSPVSSRASPVSARSSPNHSKLPTKNASPSRVSSSPQPEVSKSTLSTSLDEDYVIVPKNIPTDHSTESLEKERGTVPKKTQSPCEPENSNSSPPRPSTLPVASQPIPTPQRNTRIRRDSEQEKRDSDQYSSNGPSVVPRSAPINMVRHESKPEIDIDISSLSPPSVKFMIGTPPGGRRRSTSSGSYSETPPPTIWNGSGSRSGLSNSPLRRSGTSPPGFSNALARVPMLSAPNLSDNNNPAKGPIFSTRAMTLPEISEIGNMHSLYNDNDHPIQFVAPELPEETLLGKEHNETLAKINYVLALSNCILSIAAQKSATPLISLSDSAISNTNTLEQKMEQIILQIRVLQLLSSGLTLASKQIRAGVLKPSSNVKKVVTILNQKFKETLSACRQLNRDGLISKIKTPEFTVDTILYEHAVQMCQSAATDELLGKGQHCGERYQTAQIILHSLSQQINSPCDQEKLTEYKEAVERRLRVLQQQGLIYTTDFS